MKWYIEDKDSSTVFESMSYQKAFDEWNRLCDTSDGWWSLYRNDDPDEPWCAGGLEELQPANIVCTPTNGGLVLSDGVFYAPAICG